VPQDFHSKQIAVECDRFISVCDFEDEMQSSSFSHFVVTT